MVLCRAGWNLHTGGSMVLPGENRRSAHGCFPHRSAPPLGAARRPDAASLPRRPGRPRRHRTLLPILAPPVTGPLSRRKRGSWPAIGDVSCAGPGPPGPSPRWDRSRIRRHAGRPDDPLREGLACIGSDYAGPCLDAAGRGIFGRRIGMRVSCGTSWSLNTGGKVVPLAACRRRHSWGFANAAAAAAVGAAGGDRAADPKRCASDRPS
jgi:hypothetical protein